MRYFLGFLYDYMKFYLYLFILFGIMYFVVVLVCVIVMLKYCILVKDISKDNIFIVIESEGILMDEFFFNVL